MNYMRKYIYLSSLHPNIYRFTSVQINLDSPLNKLSCQFLTTCFLAPNFDTSRREVFHLIEKMAHKKAILDKFILASSSTSSDSSSDCRSPVHNGSRWLIPEISLSDEGNKKKEQDEDPDQNIPQDKPSTSSTGIQAPSSTGIQPQLSLARNRNEEEQVVQEKKSKGSIEFNQETNSSSEWKNFPTDTSPVSTSQSKKDTNSSGLTVPFLGTEAHPITADSSSLSEKEGTTGFNTPASTRGTECEDSDQTIIVTSTPIKGNQPKLRRSEVETKAWDLPSEIFGSPSEEIEERNVDPSSSELNEGRNDSPSSVTSSDHELTKALREMGEAVQHSQKMRKRTFFSQTIAGE